MNVEIGAETRYSFSGNICFEISVFCLCSAGESVKVCLVYEQGVTAVFLSGIHFWQLNIN
jgi:hypothetical protein